MFNINWWQFTPNEALGVDDYPTNENDGILVYPNPSSTGLFTLSKETNWKVFSLSGQKAMEGKGNKIYLTGLAKGFYSCWTEFSTHKLIYK